MYFSRFVDTNNFFMKNIRLNYQKIQAEIIRARYGNIIVLAYAWGSYQ